MLGAAAAQEYPTRPINVIVPAAAGGPTDAISRITAQAMSPRSKSATDPRARACARYGVLVVGEEMKG
jgi:tripartite-type tricarboxylate transporter receptor subunit TctC